MWGPFSVYNAISLFFVSSQYSILMPLKSKNLYKGHAAFVEADLSSLIDVSLREGIIASKR